MIFGLTGKKILSTSYSGLDKGDNLSAGDIKSVNQSVEEDRKFWVQACIARIMKSLKEATYSTLIQRIHSEAANRFQELYLSLCTQKHSFLFTYVYVSV